MQPSPSAETVSPCRPNVRVSNVLVAMIVSGKA
jgi:hypothetical protein